MVKGKTGSMPMTLRKKRMKLIEAILTLGGLLGIVLSFIVATPYLRSIVVIFLVLFVVCSLTAYSILTFELKVEYGIGMIIYDIVISALAISFSNLLGLVISLYPNELLVIAVIAYVDGMVATVMLVDFHPSLGDNNLK